MKTLFKSLMVLIIISLAKNSYPQKQEILENFKVFETNGQVLLNWQIVQGSTCFGIGILQSTNQLDFTEIGHIPGVCGASNDPLGYQFIDSNPIKNQFNYYRLNLGGYGYSEILAIKDFVNNGGILLLAGLGWSWLVYHPEKTLDELPANKLGKEFGMRWVDGVITELKDFIYNDATVFSIFYPESLFVMKRANKWLPMNNGLPTIDKTLKHSLLIQAIQILCMQVWNFTEYTNLLTEALTG